jgi:NDP-sugar pyrophosphorylase family protein
MKAKITITLDEKILKNVDAIVDRIYIRNRSQAIEHLIEESFSKDRKAVILATGNSKSLLIDKNEYRVTAKIKGTTVIETTLKALKDNGFKEIFILGEQEILTAIFNLVRDGKRYGVKINFIEDKDPPGTAASLRLLKGEIKNTFLVIYGDIIFNSKDIEKLWRHHFKHKGITTLLVSSLHLTLGGSKRKIITSPLKIEGDSVVKVYPKTSKAIKEIEDSSIIFASIFVTEPEILEYTGHWLENDVFPKLAEQGLLYSYLNSEEIIHIHSKEDKKLVM